MKKNFWALFLSISFLACSISFAAEEPLDAGPSKQKTPEAVRLPESDTEDSFFNIYAVVSSVPPLDDAGPVVFGTSFAIDEDLMLTAGHVCQRIQEVNAEVFPFLDESMVLFASIDNKGHVRDEVTMGVVLQIDDETDSCILLAPSHGLRFLDLDESYDKLLAGDRIVVVGSPLDAFYVKEFGTIISISDERLYINTHIEHGNSGSPVIRNGKIIALVSAYSENLRREVFAVPSPCLIKLLKKAGLRPSPESTVDVRKPKP